MTLPVKRKSLVDLPDTSSLVRVLVVDDEPDIATSLAELLTRKEGYEVTIASDGYEAMAILEEEAADPTRSIDLVLLDVELFVLVEVFSKMR